MPIPSSEPTRAASLKSTGTRLSVNQSAPVLDGIKNGVDHVTNEFLKGRAEGERDAEKINVKNRRDAVEERRLANEAKVKADEIRRTKERLQSANFSRGKSQSAIDEVRYQNELNERLTQGDVNTDNALDVISDFDEKFTWTEPPEDINDDQRIALEQTQTHAKSQIIGRAETRVFQQIEEERIAVAEEAASVVLGEHGKDGEDKAREILGDNGLSEAQTDSFINLTLEAQREERSAEFRKTIDAAADKFQENLDLEAFDQVFDAINSNEDLTESERQVLTLQTTEQRNRAIRDYADLVSNFELRTSKGIATDKDLVKLATYEDVIPRDQYNKLLNDFDNQIVQTPEDVSYRQDNIYKDISANIYGLLREGAVLQADEQKAFVDDITNSALPVPAKGELLRELQQLRHANIVALVRTGEIEALPKRFAQFSKEDYELALPDLTYLNQDFQRTDPVSEFNLREIGNRQEHLLRLAKNVNSFDIGSQAWKVAKDNYDFYALAAKTEVGRQRYREILHGR